MDPPLPPQLPPPPVQVVQMTPELLAHLVVQTATQAHAAPLEAMRQQQELHLQSIKMMQDQNILAMQMLERYPVHAIHRPHCRLPRMGFGVSDQEGTERTP